MLSKFLKPHCTIIAFVDSNHNNIGSTNGNCRVNDCVQLACMDDYCYHDYHYYYLFVTILVNFIRDRTVEIKRS